MLVAVRANHSIARTSNHSRLRKHRLTLQLPYKALYQRGFTTNCIGLFCLGRFRRRNRHEISTASVYQLRQASDGQGGSQGAAVCAENDKEGRRFNTPPWPRLPSVQGFRGHLLLPTLWWGRIFLTLVEHSLLKKARGPRGFCWHQVLHRFGFSWLRRGFSSVTPGFS